MEGSHAMLGRTNHTTKCSDCSGSFPCDLSVKPCGFIIIIIRARVLFSCKLPLQIVGPKSFDVHGILNISWSDFKACSQSALLRDFKDIPLPADSGDSWCCRIGSSPTCWRGFKIEIRNCTCSCTHPPDLGEFKSIGICTWHW